MGFVMDQPAIPVKRVVEWMLILETVIPAKAGIQYKGEAD
jgi:hypothetical protein